MKNSKIILTAFVIVLSLCGCDKREREVKVSSPTGSLSVSMDSFGTKATISNRGREGIVNTAQLLLFNASGELYRYHSLTAGEISAGTVTVQDIKTGTYSVSIVANGPDLSGVKALPELNAMTTLLGEHNATATAFLMTASDNVTVPSDVQAAVSLTLRHSVGRIVVSQITNALPASLGALTVKSIMLTNVCGSWKLTGGKPSSITWYNREGRKDESPRNSSHIIDGASYASSCPDLLWRSVNTDIAAGASYGTAQYLYAFPNDATAAPNGFLQPFNPQQTCVVVTASIGGSTYYYPVPLSGGIASNMSYDVQLTVQGPGSADPNRPVTPGTMKATVTVKDWYGTKTYNENI